MAGMAREDIFRKLRREKDFLDMFMGAILKVRVSGRANLGNDFLRQNVFSGADVEFILASLIN
jgi:hypothetical protein